MDPVSLASAIAAVKTVGTTVHDLSIAVGSLRSGVLARNEKTKQGLEEQLIKLQDSLRHAGHIAMLAADYSRTSQKVRILLELCKRADGFVRENIDSLNNPSDSRYALNWRTLEMIFDGIRDNREVPTLAALDRAHWYDDQDRYQIDIFLGQFQSAYNSASEARERKAALTVDSKVKEMIEKLSTVNSMLDDSLYKKMFDALAALDADQTAIRTDNE